MRTRRHPTTRAGSDRRRPQQAGPSAARPRSMRNRPPGNVAFSSSHDALRAITMRNGAASSPLPNSRGGERLQDGRSNPTSASATVEIGTSRRQSSILTSGQPPRREIVVVTGASAPDRRHGRRQPLHRGRVSLSCCRDRHHLAAAGCTRRCGAGAQAVHAGEGAAAAAGLAVDPRRAAQTGRDLAVVGGIPSRQPNGYSYSRFCDLHAAWRVRLSPTMRQTHPAGGLRLRARVIGFCSRVIRSLRPSYLDKGVTTSGRA